MAELWSIKFVFRKAVFSKVLLYDIIHLSEGGLVLKLSAFQVAFLTKWLCTGSLVCMDIGHKDLNKSKLGQDFCVNFGSF